MKIKWNLYKEIRNGNFKIIIDVDPKTIRNNLNKSMIFTPYLEKKKDRIIEYSFDKWLKNHLAYNHTRKLIGEKLSINYFNEFLNDLINWKNWGEYNVDYLIYIFKKQHPSNK